MQQHDRIAVDPPAGFGGPSALDPAVGSKAKGGEGLTAAVFKRPLSGGKIHRDRQSGWRRRGVGGSRRRRVGAAQDPCRPARRRIGAGDGGAGLLLPDIGEADSRAAFRIVEGQGAVLGRPEPRLRIGIAADAAFGRQGDPGGEAAIGGSELPGRAGKSIRGEGTADVPPAGTMPGTETVRVTGTGPAPAPVRAEDCLERHCR